MNGMTVLNWLDMAEKIGRNKYKVKDLLDVRERGANGDAADIETVKTRHKKKKERETFEDKNPMWATWVRRVFVSSKSDAELELDF